MAQNRGSGSGGAKPTAANRFLRFSHKKHSFKRTFIEIGRTVPAVSAVSNGQYKNILVGLPKSLGMSKSRSLAKINERRMQLY